MAQDAQPQSEPSAGVPDDPVRFADGLRLIRGYARLHPRPFARAVTGAAVFGLATVGSSWALARLTDKVIKPVFAGLNPPILSTFGLFVLMGVLRVLFGVLRRANASFVRYDNLATWQTQVVRRLIDQPLSFFRRNTTGDLLGAAETDAVASVDIMGPLPYASGVVVLLIAAAAWMLSIDGLLGLTSLSLLPFLAFSNHIFQKRIDGPAQVIQKELSKLAGAVHEMVDGFGAIKALGLETQIGGNVHGQVNAVAEAKIRALKVKSIFETAQEVLLPIVNVFILLLGAYRVRAGAVTVGQVAGVLSLFNLLVWPLRLLAFALADLPASVVSARRVRRILDQPVAPPPETVNPENDTHAYELSNVTLVHDDGRVALSDVSLTIPKNTKVAIVGATGSGKSTLLDLLAGLEVPTSGVIRRATHTVSAVFQEPIVLSGPLVDSLTLGFSLDQTRVDRAVAAAEASFVDDLPSGRSTAIGERGVTLSGGQRQRVALARALAFPSSVLLLDDTTSSLDATTEQKVLQSLSEMKQDQTIVIVSARPTSISFADSIIVLDEGRIVGSGTHDELFASNEIYQELFTALSNSSTELAP
jgi:ATP-binding cassette, subfamily B, bacterial